MPIYEYQCPAHDLFWEVVPIDNTNHSYPCPICQQEAKKVMPLIAFSKVIHTEKLPHNAPERVADRNRLMKDTAVKKELDRYTESERSQKYSPYYRREI